MMIHWLPPLAVASTLTIYGLRLRARLRERHTKLLAMVALSGMPAGTKIVRIYVGGRLAFECGRFGPLDIDVVRDWLGPTTTVRVDVEWPTGQEPVRVQGEKGKAAPCCGN